TAKYNNFNNSRVGHARNEIGSTALNMAFNVNGGSSTTTSADTIDLSGTSGYRVFAVRVVGHPEAEGRFSDSSATSWTLSGIQLAQGANPLTIEALDADGKVVHTDTFTVNKTGNARPVVAVDPNPGSFNVALSDTLELDAGPSYDPEGTSLVFDWSVAGPGGVNFTNPTAETGWATFEKPGLYQFSITATDGNSRQQSLVREASVFAESGWSSFSDRLLDYFWALDNVEVRRDYTPG
ncbi:MAG: hypothetical protein GWO24_33235, partial [Akkermansiaceae bacterium]|nr:hypothetical protein [Akkermansiaceae bacterium]